MLIVLLCILVPATAVFTIRGLVRLATHGNQVQSIRHDQRVCSTIITMSSHDMPSQLPRPTPLGMLHQTATCYMTTATCTLAGNWFVERAALAQLLATGRGTICCLCNPWHLLFYASTQISTLCHSRSDGLQAKQQGSFEHLRGLTVLQAMQGFSSSCVLPCPAAVKPTSMSMLTYINAHHTA